MQQTELGHFTPPPQKPKARFMNLGPTRTPRSKCKTCGVKTTTVPWAGKHSRFTLMFEAFAIEVLKACGNVKSAAALLDLDWDSVHSMMERAVERGLLCRDLESLQYVGIDEKSFRSGHSYVSILTDLTGHRVLEVVEDRTEEATDKLWACVFMAHRKKSATLL